MTTDTPEKILQVARRLFVQQGYTATSMRQVAEETGIGKATIYHHFPDKQAIIMALLEQNQAKTQDNLARMRAETDPRERFRVAAELSIQYLPGGREHMMKGFGAFMQEFRLLLSDAVQRGIEQGIFREVDPAEAARVFQTMIQGSFAMVYMSGERPRSPAQTAAVLLDVFFNGINAR
jgi:AcrR family transcriptional regulator